MNHEVAETSKEAEGKVAVRRERNAKTTVFGCALFLLLVLSFLEVRCDTRWLKEHSAPLSFSSQVPSYAKPLLAQFQFTNNTTRISQLHTKDGTLQQQPIKTNFSRKTKLEFIHITKTGGTAIERAASFAGISWGMCHYVETTTCPRDGKVLERPLSNATGRPMRTQSPWHMPPKFMNPSPYPDDTVFFAVVRHPYDRMISEFYCPHAGFKLDVRRGKKRNARALNWWIQDILGQGCDRKFRNGFSASMHFIPQHHYVYDHHGGQLIKHVLRHETLQRDFKRLMKQYNLSNTVRLVGHVNRARPSRYDKTKLLPKDLSKETLKAIHACYKEDFKRLGYKKRHPWSARSINVTGYMDT